MDVRQQVKPGKNREARTDAEATEGAVYLLTYHVLLSCLLIEHRKTCQEVTPPTIGGALPHQSLIKKISSGQPIS